LFIPLLVEVEFVAPPVETEQEYENERRRLEEELNAMRLEHSQQMREILDTAREDEEKRKKEEEQRSKEHENLMSEMLEQRRRESEQRRVDEEARIIADREARRQEKEEQNKKEEEKKKEREKIMAEEKKMCDIYNIFVLMTCPQSDVFRWEAKQRAIDEDLDQTREQYAEASNVIREERDAKLFRIAEERQKDRDEFDEKLRIERQRRASAHEVLRNRFRSQMAELYKRIHFGLWTKYIEAQWSNRLDSLR
ncbi:hypothetical protein PENTCL1PPCAC_27301, partial [Pristionchus entomophagus]